MRARSVAAAVVVIVMSFTAATVPAGEVLADSPAGDESDLHGEPALGPGPAGICRVRGDLPLGDAP